MAETKKAASKKIADVAHPGQSAPSANSKSVIINNRPLLKDPMVVADESDEPVGLDTPPNKSPAVTKKRSTPQLSPTLAASTDGKTEAAAETESTQPAPAKEDAKPTSPEAAKVTDAQPPATAKPDKPDTDQDQAADKPAESESTDEKTPPAKDEKQIEAAAAEAAKRQAAIDKLADSKQYYLPINTVEKRRSRRFVLLGVVLSLLLILAWADIALDAGLIHLGGIKPPTHFFSN